MSYVLPGTGWPEDPASPSTPVARDAREVAELAGGSRTLAELTARQSVCRACPRLVEWREEVADVKRRAFADEVYWGRPVPGWGEENPRILLVGLAPAAHGGNRTGRIFTGDRSGDWLFASLHRVGLAAQDTSVRAGDGQRLIGARVAAAVRCAPPANKPLPQERSTCAPWLLRELALVAGGLKVVVALGSFAWQAAWGALKEVGYELPQRRAPFGHGVEVAVTRGAEELTLIGCYHPSQQNTFTGRVTAHMLDAIFARARDVAM
ncbi:uracil-DNA glycosylase [Sinosporangium siamense]|uniref:Type-5 uracil-DNA glycosylase n=1 Tax=Sinosporangium siamense TaxID=1367973 RepID=A0A919RI52_9ACTN|nr:uracil-DNA glycosylase [Sinosporangium siamense]GII93245.1 uracil-DNA glycosylase [Sinosporangium siamense]